MFNIHALAFLRRRRMLVKAKLYNWEKRLPKDKIRKTTLKTLNEQLIVINEQIGNLLMQENE